MILSYSTRPMQGQGNQPPYFHAQPGMVNGDGHLYQGQGSQHPAGGPLGPGQYQQRPQMKVWNMITFKSWETSAYGFRAISSVIYVVWYLTGEF